MLHGIRIYIQDLLINHRLFHAPPINRGCYRHHIIHSIKQMHVAACWLEVTNYFPIQSSKLHIFFSISPDTISIIPTDEGSKAASLALVTVWAHQTISTSAVSAKLSTAHFSWTFKTDSMSAVIRCCSIHASIRLNLRRMLGAGGWEGRPPPNTRLQYHQNHRHHHHLQMHRSLSLCSEALLGTEEDRLEFLEVEEGGADGIPS